MSTKTISREVLLDAMDRAALAYDYLDDYSEAIRDDYSGRGMYGQVCVALSVDRLQDALAVVAALAVSVAVNTDEKDGDGEDIAVEIGRAAQLDSMGRGQIVYWPGWTLAD